MQTSFIAPVLPFIATRNFSPNRQPRRPKTTMVVHNLRKSTPSEPSPRVNSQTPSPSQDNLSGTLSILRSSPIMLCIRMDSPSTAIAAASAAIRGGIRCVEVALTTPSAPSVIRTLTTNFPSALIGAGTVLTPADVCAAASASAKFALSPITDGPLISEIHKAGMLAVPGAATPTEIYAAYNAGALLVKVFPVNLLGGVDFVKAMQGPLGHIPLLPTSGVDEQKLREYLMQRNVACVGASRQILPKEAIKNEDWSVVEENARIWAGIASEYVPFPGSGR